ncbi:MAG: DUF4097 family beta strand repeat-containing protein [Dehalococcoidia bacterium]
MHRAPLVSLAHRRVSVVLARALLATILAAIGAGCAPRPMVAFSDRFATPSTVRLVLVVDDGSVTVTEAPEGAVIVSGEHPRDVHQYAGSVAAGEARIELRRRRGLDLGIGQRGAHIEVQVPRGSSVNVDSSNGGVDIAGTFEVSRIKASNGAVRVAGATGATTIEVSNGRVGVERHTGDLAILTSNGAIEVVDQRGGALRLETSNGAIRFDGAIEGGDNTFETSNAAIEVAVRGTPSFILDASTSNGSVGSRFAVLEGTKAQGKLTGRVGDGLGRLVLRTSNGPIEVR